MDHPFGHIPPRHRDLTVEVGAASRSGGGGKQTGQRPHRRATPRALLSPPKMSQGRRAWAARPRQGCRNVMMVKEGRGGAGRRSCRKRPTSGARHRPLSLIERTKRAPRPRNLMVLADAGAVPGRQRTRRPKAPQRGIQCAAHANATADTPLLDPSPPRLARATAGGDCSSLTTPCTPSSCELPARSGRRPTRASAPPRGAPRPARRPWRWRGRRQMAPPPPLLSPVRGSPVWRAAALKRRPSHEL